MKIIKYLFYLILIGITFIGIKYGVQYFVDFQNDKDNDLGGLTNVLTKPGEIVKLQNGDFFEKFWDIDSFYKTKDLKKFSYVSELIVLIGSNIKYKEATCSYNKEIESMKCKTVLKELEKFGQITEIKITINDRDIIKSAYRIPIPGFFMIGNRNGFSIKTEKKYDIYVNKDTMLEEYNMSFTKLQNLLKLISN